MAINQQKRSKAAKARSGTGRVGIYAGAFDPVHAGHIAFALQALQTAKLDAVYFLPERRPRGKQGIEHFGHRVAMLRRALKPHPQFGLLELVDISFSVKRTLPQLRQQLGLSTQLVFLFGSDAIASLPQWPNAARLLKKSELVIGLRDDTQAADVQAQISAWPVQPRAVRLLQSHAPTVSSSTIRDSLRHRMHTPGLLRSVQRYSDRNWLYVSVG